MGVPAEVWAYPAPAQAGGAKMQDSKPLLPSTLRCDSPSLAQAQSHPLLLCSLFLLWLLQGQSNQEAWLEPLLMVLSPHAT